MGSVNLRVAVLMSLLAFYGCGLWNPASSLDFAPSRVPVGELTVGVWLPAGLEEFRFGVEDQARLAELGINWIEWLQRAMVDSATAEELAMEFCDRTGMRMPVYYEPRGFSPYDKLHNWAARAEVEVGFSEEVRRRVRRLRDQWMEAPGFGGYLVGHEDYRKAFYPALEQVVAVLREEDSGRPAFAVGGIDSYPATDGFLEAFFQEGGAPNVFQHEQYVFRADVSVEGKGLQRRLDELVDGYDRVARRLQGRYGRWHAIVQAQGETRDGEPFYRRPTGAELSVQAGLALARGASGIVYFLYSSGVEEVLNGEGEGVQQRFYAGLVDVDGAPTGTYGTAQRLNAELDALSPVLAELHFHGGFASGQVPDNSLLRQGENDLEFGLFGDGIEATHLLVVNRRTIGKRTVGLVVEGEQVVDAAANEPLDVENGQVQVELEAGGFRLLAISQGE